MLEAAALAEPQERPVLEPHRVAVLVHPCRRRLAKQAPRAAGRRVGQVQIEPGLLAVLHLVNDLLRVGSPADIDDQKLERRSTGEIDPGRVAARDARESQLHRRIRISGLRVVGDFERWAIGDVVDDGVFGNRPFVELQEGEASRVGAPPVAPELSAPVNLFLIEPIEFPVEPLVVSVGRERLFALRGEVDDVTGCYSRTKATTRPSGLNVASSSSPA